VTSTPCRRGTASQFLNVASKIALLLELTQSDGPTSMPSPEAKIKLFADVTNMFIFSDNIVFLHQKARNCIAQLHQWFTVNKFK
jgi:hypothetical protein